MPVTTLILAETPSALYSLDYFLKREIQSKYHNRKHVPTSILRGMWQSDRVCMHSPSALRQSGIWPEDAHDSFNKYESKLIQIACDPANERTLGA